MSRPSQHRVLPGFRLSLGYTWFYLGLIVLIPLSSLFLRTFSLSWDAFWSTVTTSRALAAYRLSFGASLAAALANVVFGLLVAWVLVRYRFPGRDVLESLVDLPFALPTAVAGLTLTTLFSAKGWYGQHLEVLGIKVAYTSVGVAVALTFIGLPFVVRTVQPVLEDIDVDVEEAAATLGATPWQTFRRVLFPAILPALLSGFTLAFARALGEYGSVVFISGNMPLRTEIVPLLIITRLEQYDYEGATAIAIVMLMASFSLLLAVNLLHRWSHRRLEARPGA
ncbi:sulfate ABC transporter permease subunit CysT [Myxococcus sp. Y35]|uniref:sulfate ABC transporter permease subunit CysT n=1 Tax=Pseudomyxococcus flavus TaxID=3115648 RepID=UPI003CF599C4